MQKSDDADESDDADDDADKSDVEEKVSLYKLLKKYPIKFGLNSSKHIGIWNKARMAKYPPLEVIVANLSRIEIKNYGVGGGRKGIKM